MYKAHFFPEADSVPVLVAVKTLRGTVSELMVARGSATVSVLYVKIITALAHLERCCHNNVLEFLTESLKMQQFNHPNVMGLLGVCLDAGPTPYIVLPFLSGGNLLSYVRNRASSLLLSDKALSTKVQYMIYSAPFSLGLCIYVFVL